MARCRTVWDGMAFARERVMASPPLPHFAALRSLGSLAAAPARPQAAPNDSVDGPTTAAPSGFATLLSQLQSAKPTVGATKLAPQAVPVGATPAGITAATGDQLAAAGPAIAPGVAAKADPKAVATDRPGAKSRAAAGPDALTAAPTPDLVPPPPAAALEPAAPGGLRLAAASVPTLEQLGSAPRAAGPELPQAQAQNSVAVGAAEPVSLLATAPAAAITQPVDATALLPAIEPSAPSLLAASATPPAAATAEPAISKSATPAPAPASQQVAPALVQLSHTATGGQLTVRLNPDDLGQVHIQIDRAADGSASVHVTAERPETLQLLASDQAQLHRALDHAGLPQEGRTLTLSLAPPDAAGSNSFGPGGGSSSGGSSGDASAGNPQNGQQGRPSNWRPGNESGAWGSGTDPATFSIITGDAATRLRAGVDITA